MPIAANVHQCHHVRTSGLRCGSPAMRNRDLCFFHFRVTAIPRSRPLDMPNLEDGNAIQHGLACVIRRLLTYDIDYKAAYCLLHAYKLSLWNLKNCHHPARNDRDVVTVDPASDPENAGDATEPLSPCDLEKQYRTQHPEEFPEDNHEPELDQHEQLVQLLARELKAPKGGDSKEDRAPSMMGAPPARFSQMGSESRNTTEDRAPSNAASSPPHWVGAEPEDVSSRAKPRDPALESDSAPQRSATPSLRKREPGNGQPTQESEGRHYLAQDATKWSPGKTNNGSSPEGTAHHTSGRDKRPIQRITIPREIEDLIKGEDHPELSGEELLKLAAEMFNIKTG